MSPNKLAVQRALRQNPKTLASASRAFFATHYLGLLLPPHQYRWYEELGKRHDHNLLLSPRDHGKTTVLPRVIAEHITLFNPGTNILLLSKTYDQSVKSLRLIKSDLMKNKRIKHDFSRELSDFYPVKNTLTYNVGDRDKRDATIEGNGIGGGLTGSHFNWIIMDDIFDDENSRTYDSRVKYMDWIEGTALPLLEPGGKIVAIGTRKHYDDGYSKWLKNPLWFCIKEKMIQIMPKYSFVREDVGGKEMIVDVNVEGEYQTLWPSKWGIKEALIKMASMRSPVMFEREYQNNPIGMKGNIFKDLWLEGNQYAQNRLKSKEYNVPERPALDTFDKFYQGVDLAITKKDWSDYFVITTVGVKRDPFKIYILDWYRDQLDFNEQEKAVPAQFRKWNNAAKGVDVSKIAIESNNYQLALSQKLLHNIPLPIKEVVSKENKGDRIAGDSVHYANGLIQLPIDHKNYMDFLMEFTAFDGAAHDDLLDATNIAIRAVLDDEYGEEKSSATARIASVPIW